MEVVILPDAEQAAAATAAVMESYVRRGGVIGLATGRTQAPVYAKLRHLDWSGVVTFNLDEYVGATTFADQMHEQLFRFVKPRRVRMLDGHAADLRQECDAFEQDIRSVGGIDLQLLGIGSNGHIGYNEPTSALQSRTRPKTLMRDGKHVLTMGIGTILEAKRCLLVATGAAKADAVAAMVEGPLTAMLPASALQLHPRTTVVLDAAAAAHLKLAEYYRMAHAQKPEWQRAVDGL